MLNLILYYVKSYISFVSAQTRSLMVPTTQMSLLETTEAAPTYLPAFLKVLVK